MAIDQGARDAELAIDRARREVGSQRAYFASRGLAPTGGGASSRALENRTIDLAYEDANNIIRVAESRAASIRQAGASAVNKANAQALSSLGDAGAYLTRGFKYAADRWG